MAKCPNRNTDEYKVLKEKFKTNIATDNIINTWQDLNKSENFPTLKEAVDFKKNQKVFYSLKQNEFAEALLANLSRLQFISKLGDNYYVNNSDRTTWDPSTWEYNEKILEKNLKFAKKYLDINNISPEAVDFVKTEKAYKVVVKKNIFSPADEINAKKNRTSPHSNNLIVHLQRIFPQTNIEIVSVKVAEEYYNSLPEEQKARAPFKDIRSFYVNGEAVLIKGRTSNETAIEEVLHPFVDGLFIDNRELFDGLLEESKINFPVLWQGIQDSYTNRKGFNDTVRELELVTQALSRHFNNEFEKTPTTSFKNKIKQFLKWFSGIIKNFHQYLTGRPLVIKPASLKENAKLTDIAKLLNTSDIEFRMERIIDSKVKYSLTPEKESIIEFALSQTVNDHQANVIKRLFNTAMLDEAEFDNLVAGVSQPTESDSLVAFDKASHTYVDVVTGEPYLSATTAIKGGMTQEKQKEVELNLEIGNEFDMILDAIISNKSFDAIKDSIKLLDPVKAEIAYNNMLSNIRMLTADGGVAIPQVILYDKETQIAGTADLLVITKEGRIKVLDLKTSKNFVRNNEGYDGKKWELEGPREETVNGKKVIVPGSLLKQKGVDRLSTKQQHNLQVNLYRRMLENMGYEVDQSDWAASTFHIKVDIEGKGKDQKFLGTFETDDWIPHPSSQNMDKVNMLIPRFTDVIAEQEINESKELSDDTPVDMKNILTDDEKIPEKLSDYTEYSVISGILDDYKGALVTQQKAIDMIRSNIYMDRSKKETKEYIMNSIAAVNVAKGEGPKARAALYTSFLTDALKQIRSFTEYVEDPKNFSDPAYIGYVLNFDRFIETYRGLYSIQKSDELNATQRSLVLNLQLELNKLETTKTSGEGLIDQAITNYGREVIKSKSNKDFGKEELDDLLMFAKDISMGEFSTGDLATSSDTILAVMDKIYKAKKQQLLDRLQIRDEIIRQKAFKLQKLSPEKDPQKLYQFMIEFDENGEPTGEYVKKLGKNYYGKLKELRSQFFDDNGQWLKYRDVTNIEDASKEDIEFNIKLANAKKEFSDFWRAETKGPDGKPAKGNYHYYSEEFKKERDKFEYFSPIGEHGVWRKRSAVSSRAYARFQAKYYEEVDYIKAVRKNGRPTGQIVRDQSMPVPKRKYRIAREEAKDGTPLLSEKYQAIMNNTDTELGRAQKDFYETFVRIYEKELLEKLPMGQRGQMLGKIPLIKARMFQNLKDKPNIVTRLWTKMSRGIDNLITETSQQKVIITDEAGDLVDSLPVFYTGNARNEEELKNILAEIDALDKERKEGKIKKRDYKDKRKVLKAKQSNIQNKPSLGELNLDLGTALMKFNGMAEHYETMSEVEDTLKALVKVIEKRTYTDTTDTEVYKKIRDKAKNVGAGKYRIGKPGTDSLVLSRAKKWMSMVYYDNEQITKGFLSKVSDGLISVSSLSYVAFNPFGNFNNYALGKINNNIEMLGGRFFSKEAYMRAVWEYNKRAIPNLIERTATGSTMNQLGDLATGNVFNLSKNNAYDPQKPLSKYEAFVDYLRMMDPSTDIRESGKQADKAIDSWLKKASEFGYILQDAAEYNVQSKAGMAIVIDTRMYNPETGEDLALYDAMVFDGETQELKMKEGFTQVLKKNGQKVDFNDDFRYDLRNEIREVNKQIHGNYAAEDRMVIQSYAVGRLAAQFHKWVAPAIKARFREEYFDENLGWMEGRYKSALSFSGYALGQIRKGEIDFTNYGKGFLEDQGYQGDGSQTDQKATNKLLNTYRTLGEIAIILATFATSEILIKLFADDDDDSENEKRFENFMMYQANRTYKELILMMPISPDSWTQMYQMAKSPIAATRTLGELGEALSLTMRTPVAMLYYDDKKFKGNSDFVYQRKPKKGDLKVAKAWKDVIPLVYTLQKWDNFSQMKDFFIK